MAIKPREFIGNDIAFHEIPLSKEKDSFYITKDGVKKKRPTRNKIKTNPKIDYEFGKFMTILRTFLLGKSKEEKELYFNTYIRRMEKVKQFAFEHDDKVKYNDDEGDDYEQ